MKNLTITVACQKGEMAKSTSAINLIAAARLCDASTRMALVDLDAQQNDAKRFAPSLPDVAFFDDLPAKSSGITIIDTPPSVTRETMAAMVKSDLILIPCTPATLSLEALARTFETIATAREKAPQLQARVVFTRADASQYSQGLMNATRVLAEWKAFQVVIPFRRAEFEKAAAARHPVVGGKGAGAAAYTALWDEIRELFNDTK